MPGSLPARHGSDRSLRPYMAGAQGSPPPARVPLADAAHPPAPCRACMDADNRRRKGIVNLRRAAKHGSLPVREPRFIVVELATGARHGPGASLHGPDMVTGEAGAGHTPAAVASLRFARTIRLPGNPVAGQRPGPGH